MWFRTKDLKQVVKLYSSATSLLKVFKLKTRSFNFFIVQTTMLTSFSLIVRVMSQLRFCTQQNHFCQDILSTTFLRIELLLLIFNFHRSSRSNQYNYSFCQEIFIQTYNIILDVLQMTKKNQYTSNNFILRKLTAA